MRFPLKSRRNFCKSLGAAFGSLPFASNLIKCKSKPRASEQVSAFKNRGFYLHACWQFEYPFAVRSWRREDFAHMFQLLRMMNMNRVMLWPMMEVAPPPLSEKDAEFLRQTKNIINDAQDSDLECWITASPRVPGGLVP